MSLRRPVVGLHSHLAEAVNRTTRAPVPKKQASPVDAQVGNRVRLRRMLIGMSQEKLGDFLGLTFQQVQKYEKGVNRIGAGRLFGIAQVLGVPISYFYEDATGDESMRGFAEDAAAP